MKRRMRFLSFILAGCLLLTACGSKENKKDKNIIEDANSTGDTNVSTEQPDNINGTDDTDDSKDSHSGFTPIPIDGEIQNVTENEELYNRMIASSLISTGNNTRLKNVIEKARNGEEVWISTIGGSITEGALATVNTKCYAYLMYQQFAATYGVNGGENVHFINAGVSGTPSTLGMIRYEAYTKDITGVEPDLVIVEFAVNDGDDPTNGDCYESLVRNILLQDNDPAVVLLFSVFQSQWNVQERMKPIGKQYDLPMVSIKNAIGPRISLGYLNNEDFFASDGWHPTNFGHQIMADCMKYLFETVDMEERAESDITITDEVAVGNSYEGIVAFGASTVPDGVSYSAGMFTEKDTAVCSLQYDNSRNIFPDNWKRDINSSKSMTFKINCKNFVIAYKSSSSSNAGAIDVYVDGKLITTINSYSTGAWNNAGTVIIFNDEKASKHSIEIKMAQGSEEKDFTILRIGYTK